MNKIPPRLFQIYKPPGITSYDILRKVKKIIPKSWGKIGHFGTLDPFAEGLLIVGVAGAARLNDYIHAETTKTYLGTGILEKKTPTGDMTVEAEQIDDTPYLNDIISNFSVEFIQKQCQEKFVGEYWQAPPAFSAAKFEGKALHEWAREGIKIKKEPKKRTIFSLKVEKYEFPFLTIRFEVSSGIYIRTFFVYCAALLGTYGTLQELVREKIGPISIEKCITIEKLEAMDASELLKNSFSPQEILDFEQLDLSGSAAISYKNGVVLKMTKAQEGRVWVSSEESLLGLGLVELGQLRPLLNFPTL